MKDNITPLSSREKEEQETEAIFNSLNAEKLTKKLTAEEWNRGDTNVEEKPDVIKFLLGEGELDGKWFGAGIPEGKGPFWWRTELRKLFEKSTPPVQDKPDFNEASRNLYLSITGNLTIEQIMAKSMEYIWRNYVEKQQKV